MEKYSFVIACYNSEHTIKAVIQEISEVMSERSRLDYEIITVVDHSPDRVFNVLKHIAMGDARVRVVELAKNVGKHAALMAGYTFVKGNIVITMDDDGQCPIDRLWDLVQPLYGDFDMTVARNGKKKQSALRNWGSWINAKMAHWFIGKPKDLQLSNFFAMKRFVCDEILRYRAPYPYIDGLYLRAISNICNVPMEDRKRASGKSGYTLKKCISLFFNGFTSFSVKPLRAASILGAMCSIIAFFAAILIAAKKIAHPTMATGYASLMCAILGISGINMLLLGILGEYVGRIFISMSNAPQYVIRRTIHCGSTEQEAYQNADSER